MQNKHLLLLLLAVIFGLLSACGDDPELDGDPIPLYIEITSPPDKTEYTIGEELDLTGLVVTAHYENHPDGEVHLISKITGYDKNQVGEQTVTVTFRGKSTSFTVTVKAITVTVSSNADTGAGSLRQAITSAAAGNIIAIDPSVKTIELASKLSIGESLTIEGNGVTLTPAAGWTAGPATPLMDIYFSSSGSGGTVTVRRVHFKDGKGTGSGDAAGSGGAVYNLGGNLTFESCIFSGNSTDGTTAYGGAIYNSGTGTLSVKGCTFYQNSSRTGGAIYSGGTLTLTGNLFYGNTATSLGPVVYVRSDGGTVTSNGYNVVDVELGTTTAQSGWASGVTGDTYRAASPFSSTATFEPVADVRSIIPQPFADSMPATDFNGDTRTYPGAPGAVK
jgi:predicted outer membrane repeat protein